MNFRKSILNLSLRTVFVFSVVLGTTESFTVIHRGSCSSEQFRCLSGECIERNGYCDGVQHNCRDNSDEIFCNINWYTIERCPEQESDWKLCANMKRCYPSLWKCDGRTDCPDGSDEQECDVGFSYILQQVTGVAASQQATILSLMNTRQSSNSINRWGQDLRRVATALYLTDPNLLDQAKTTGREIAYEISLQLLSKLVLKKEVQTYELSQYVNALLVSCIDPRDFFGINVVAKLRKRVNSSNFTNPFTILTLCNAKDSMTSDDVDKVVAAYDAHHRPLWTDTQALSIMALACLSSRPNLVVDDKKLEEMTAELKRKQNKNGTVDGLKTTALVIQALLATDSYRNDFDMAKAMQFLVQKINSKSISILDSYYILPVLGFKSLVNISADHCMVPVKTDAEVLMDLRDNQDERIQVQCSVFVGSKMEFIRTWKLKMPQNYTFYQVLETIGLLEQQYKVQYNVFEGKPYVSGLSKYFDDAEEGRYWFIYKKTVGETDKPTLVEESPVDIELNENEELILWYRSGNWNDSL